MSLTKIVDGYTPFFGNLNQEEVSSLRERINIRKYESNQRIIESGEWGDSMYLIFQGLVNINKPTQNGKYKTIHQMKSGDFFGDIAFLAGIKRSADVVAVNDSLIGEMTKRNFDEYILENPVIGCKILYHMAGELARRIVNSNHQIEALNSYLNND